MINARKDIRPKDKLQFYSNFIDINNKKLTIKHNDKWIGINQNNPWVLNLPN